MKQNRDLSEQLRAKGLALQRQGHLKAAVQTFQQALSKDKKNVSAWLNLGLISAQTNQIGLAEKAFSKALLFDTNNFVAANNLASIKINHGQTDVAIKLLEPLCRGSTQADLHYNLALCYQQQAALEKAIKAYEQAISIDPNHALSLTNLSLLRYDYQKEPDKAVDDLINVLSKNPKMGLAWHNLGHIIYQEGELYALSRLPALKNIGLNDNQALDVQCYSNALKALPGSLPTHTNFIYSLNHALHSTTEEIAVAHYQCGAVLQTKYPALPKRISKKKKVPDDKIKIGYLSADFCQHPVGNLIAPLLGHHNKKRFQIHAFYNSEKSDEVTNRIKKSCCYWHDISRKNVDLVTQLILDQKIDILIDLSGHTKGNRLDVIAKKPAPITATWLGYSNTTGLKNHDYVLTDKYSIPTEYKAKYTEQLIELPAVYGYEPPADCPRVTRRNPAAEIIFGSFNRASKINRTILNTWSEALNKTPQSKLKILGVDTTTLKNNLVDFFKSKGIEQTRIDIHPRYSFTDYFLHHQEVDIALDTLPFSGGMTTLNALWMGLPVVSLQGTTPYGNLTCRFLKHLGLVELIAGTLEEYVDLATDLANNHEKRINLRHNMRPLFQQSTLFQYKAITESAESAFEKMLLDL